MNNDIEHVVSVEWAYFRASDIGLLDWWGCGDMKEQVQRPEIYVLFQAEF